MAVGASGRSESRMVSGSINSKFFVSFPLPGKYHRLCIHSVSDISYCHQISEGECSTEHFYCYYTQVSDCLAEVQMAGFIRPNMSWIVFYSNSYSRIPISIAVYPNRVWPSSSVGLVMHPNETLSIDAKNKDTVTVTCRYHIKTEGMEIVMGKRQTTVCYVRDGLVVNNKHAYPQIVEIRNRTDDHFVNFTIEMRRKGPVDYIGCLYGLHEKRGAIFDVDWGEKWAFPANESRIVSGPINSTFFTNFTLPGTYDRVCVHIVSKKRKCTEIRQGQCSTEYFNCSVRQISDCHAEVEMTGIIPRNISWIAFHHQRRPFSFIPISLAIFPNGVWKSSSVGLVMNPNDSLFIDAKNKETVTVTCNYRRRTRWLKIVVGTNSSIVYDLQNGDGDANTCKFPEIVDIRNRTDGKFLNFTIEVKRSRPVDYLGCLYGETESRGAVFKIVWDKHYTHSAF